MPIRGTLLAESIRIGASLEGVGLVVAKIWRADAGDVDAGQPRTWTFIEFETRDEEAEALAAALSAALEPKLGWYCDFRSDEETFVVFVDTCFVIHEQTARAAPAPRSMPAALGYRQRN